MSISFDELYLHDAVLKRLEFDWNARTLTVDLVVFYAPNEAAIPSTLTFSGVRRASIPREDPWGSSTFVNRHSFSPPDLYAIEVQSGDMIEIRAEGFSLAQKPRI